MAEKEKLREFHEFLHKFRIELGRKMIDILAPFVAGLKDEDLIYFNELLEDEMNTKEHYAIGGSPIAEW